LAAFGVATEEKLIVCLLLVSDEIWVHLSNRPPSESSSALKATTAYLRAFGYDKREAALADVFIGDTGEIIEVRQKILLAAEQDDPVLITGPTGCGKTRIARLIHEQSNRGKCRFVPVNCGSIPTELLEEELFGMEKDIVHNPYLKVGLWELADGGTLFLDEIGDLRLDHQVKILHVLSTRKFRRIGGTQEIVSNARVIAATNRPLRDMLSAQTFRDDLYSRLGAFSIQMPPLDSHRDDIPRLARRIWSDVAPGLPALSHEALDFLKSVTWPDNVRGLQNAIRKLASYAPKKGPTLEQLAYVIDEAFPALRAVPSDSVASDSKTEHGPQAEFVRHLRRLDRLHASVDDALLLLSQERDLRASEVGTIRRTVTSGRNELYDLLKEPLLFFDKALAGLARLLADALDELLRLLPPTAKRKGGELVYVREAKRYCAATLLGLLKEIRSRLFGTIHLILAGQSAPQFG
jgi:DNA-binding NtrC family response regulator